MIQKNSNFDDLMDYLKILAEVQLWESSSSSMLQTVAGRQLYFGLIRHLGDQNGDGLSVESMKEIYYDKGISLTERGVRLTIRAFEAEGVVVIERATKDRRSRRIFLTEKLQEQMLKHAMVIKKAMEANYLVIKK
jgi:hypothetical protein